MSLKIFETLSKEAQKVILKAKEVKEEGNGNHYQQQQLKRDKKDHDIIKNPQAEQVQLDRYYNGRER